MSLPSNRPHRGLLFLAVVVWLLISIIVIGSIPASMADASTTTTETKSNPVSEILCPNADVLSAKLVSQICWSCLFPIRVAGATISGSFGNPDAVPEGAADKTICACEDSNGLPKFGLPAGLWVPAHLIEVVRKPYCSPILGGKSLQDSVRLWGGRKETEGDGSDKTFHNYHYFVFPLLDMLELLIQSECNPGGWANLDMLYLSELDPMWNEDELAFFQNPEAAVFANPLALAACAVDCAKTSADQPMESLFWCAGCWGNLYPFTGNIASDASGPRDTSLLAARAIAGLHRKGLAWKTYGNDALCGGTLYPMLPKRQYRLSTLFPVSEAEKPCCHYIGETPFKWGEWRTIPGVGEDYVYMVWRYTDCCLTQIK